jgi:outer membrane protein OmpA-like peptidoglycan-associated protein
MKAYGLALASVIAAAAPLPAQRAALPLPPVAGLSLVQTLTMKEGDRESVHTVQEATARGLRWIWTVVEVQPAGDTVRQAFKYAELTADIADAMRFRAFHDATAAEEHPGYTMHALSRAVYRRLRTEGSDSFQVMGIESSGPGILGMRGSVSPIRWTGRLTLASKGTVPFPLLVNGKRVEVPAFHIRARLAARGNTWEPELWVLADSIYPLLLKWVGAHRQAGNVLQTIRVDLPPSGGTGSMEGELEGGLSSGCRAELPGIYFAFNRADLDGASDRAIASVAGLLKKHPDWILTLEGHTDSIGGAPANRALSERRVEAVRARLMSAHHVEGARLKTAGYGSARPRESNGTIEGRARNRRVELVRC